MKITFIFTLALSIISLVCQAQKSINAFYDALTLNTYIHSKDKYKDVFDEQHESEIIGLLKVYYPDLSSEKSKQLAKQIYDSSTPNHNPFLEPFLENYTRLPDGPTNKPKALVELPGSVMALNLANLANTYSQFLIDRAKQELNIAFFNRLKDFFERTPEVRVLFPKATDALGNLLAYEYPVMINTLRDSFHDDLENIFFRTDDVFKLPKYKAFIVEFPEVIISLKTIQIIAEIDNARHPVDILGDFVKMPEWKEHLESLSKGMLNFYATLQIGHLLSESIRHSSGNHPIILKKLSSNHHIIQTDFAIEEGLLNNGSYTSIKTIRSFKSNNRAWITRQHLNYLLQDETAFKIYLGLLYQRSKQINITLNTVENSTQTISADLKLAQDYTLRTNSLLKKGSIILAGSNINNKSYDNKTELSKDLVVVKTSLIKSNSTLKLSSILCINKNIEVPFHEYLANHEKDMYLLRDYLIEFIELSEELEKGLLDAKSNETKIYSYLNNGIDIIESATNLSFLFPKDNETDAYVKILRNGNDMYLNIKMKRFSSAISNLSSILELIEDDLNYAEKFSANVKRDIKQFEDKLKEVKAYSARKEKRVVKRRLKSDIRESKINMNFLETTSKILKYGTFMANIVQSDSAQEVISVINAAALPVGSYTIKRESRWNVSLNSYLGPFIGTEKLDDSDLSKISVTVRPDRDSKVLGIWAPIGIATTYGTKIGSFTLFGSLIDLGAVANYRLQDSKKQGDITTEVEELPDIQLKNIFAPGVYFIYGIPKWPLSLGMGLQKGPELRGINVLEDGLLQKHIEASAYRYGFFIAVDIPIINFYTKPR